MKLRGFGFFVLALLAALTFGSVGSSSWAADAKVVSEKSGGDLPSLAQESIDRKGEFLAQERQILERQADRQYGGIEKLIDRVLWVFGLLATAVLGLFAWFFGKSKQDFKRTISETFEKQAQEIVEKEAEQLRQLYENVKVEVEDLSAYKRRQVAWVAKPDAPSLEAVLKALYATGLQNISLVTPETDKEFELGDPDLVILTFDGSDEGRRLLSVLVGNLKQKSPPVPLLIYTFSSGGAQVRLDKAELEILDGFDWYIPVNFPGQLLAQTQLLIRRSRSFLGGSCG